MISNIARIQAPVFPAFLILFLSFIICISSQLPLHADVVERIAAVVNDEPITNLEIEVVMEPVIEQYTRAYEGMELKSKLKEARKQVLDKMINDKLILQEALSIGIDVDKEQIDAYLEGVKSKFSSEEEFEQVLESKGLKIWDLKKQYKEKLLLKKTIQLKVKAEAIITPSEITNYYDEHKESFIVPETAKMYQILIRKVDGDDQADAQHKIQLISKLLDEGGDFEELAKEYSQGPNSERGGYMGAIERGQMIEKINDTIFGLEPGETSEVLETEIGFHIFKLESKTSAAIKSLEEMQDAIKDAVMQEKAQGIIDEWIAQLREKAYIGIK